MCISTVTTAAPVEHGEVETLAGPGFCDAPSRTDPVSGTVRALSVDAAGRFFAETGPPERGLVVRIAPSGAVSRLVTGVPSGIAGDAGPTESGRPPAASRIAADGDGGAYLAAGDRVVHVAADYSLTTVAGLTTTGKPNPGELHDGDGPALGARLDARSLTADPDGNLYIADRVDPRSSAFRVRLLNLSHAPVVIYPNTRSQLVVAPGSLGTVAGLSAEAQPGDAPALRSALEGSPPSLAVEGGRLYIASAVARGGATQEAVRLVNLTGSPLTAHGITAPPGDIRTLTIAPPPGDPTLGYLPGIAASPSGELYLADSGHDRVLRLDGTGIVTTVAGGGSRGFNGNGRPASGALLDGPFDVKVSPSGAVVIADRFNGEVRAVDAAGVITAVPGAGVGATAICRGGSPGQGSPVSVAAAPNGDAYVVTADLRQVKRVDTTGEVTTVAGTTEPDPRCPDEDRCTGDGDDGGAALGAHLHHPMGLVLSPRGDLGFVDAATDRVRFVNLGSEQHVVNGVTIPPGAIATVAGNGRDGTGGDGGTATTASLGRLVDRAPFPLQPLAVDTRGNLYIADLGNGRVRRVDASGTITTWAGEGAPIPRRACCTQPVSVTVDANDVLYVSTSYITAPSPRRVWAVNPGPREVTAGGVRIRAGAAAPVAGEGGQGVGGDGRPALAATFTEPDALATDRAGNLYVADTVESTVRRVDSGGRITTVAGTGEPGFNGDGLTARITRLSHPAAIAVDPCGNLLIADTGNDRVRRLNLTGPCQLAGVVWPPLPASSSSGLPVVGAVGASLLVAAIAASALGWRVRRRSRRRGRPGGTKPTEAEVS